MYLYEFFFESDSLVASTTAVIKLAVCCCYIFLYFLYFLSIYLFNFMYSANENSQKLCQYSYWTQRKIDGVKSSATKSVQNWNKIKAKRKSTEHFLKLSLLPLYWCCFVYIVVVKNGNWVNSYVVKYVEVVFESIKKMLNTQSGGSGSDSGKNKEKQEEYERSQAEKSNLWKCLEKCFMFFYRYQ